MSDWHKAPIIRPIKLTACSLGFYPVLSVSQTEPNPCAEIGVSSVGSNEKERKNVACLLIYEG